MEHGFYGLDTDLYLGDFINLLVSNYIKFESMSNP
jgi:hypothetical protein